MTRTLQRKKQIPRSLVARIRMWLSHRPVLYAFLGGIGVVLFWRGVWLTMDYLMHVAVATYAMHHTIELGQILWWDGPLSLMIGSSILFFVGAFVSSLIGNELIISGLRSEKYLAAKEEKTIHSEAVDIRGIQHILSDVTVKLDTLEQKLAKLHSKSKR
ncbi:hypothetical protein KBC54_03015 [Patescibacteria group bacterium]|nr:hypothetical protein [Patescibacteria group bacterium]